MKNCRLKNRLSVNAKGTYDTGFNAKSRDMNSTLT